MSLRARLLLSVALLVTVALLVAGGLVVGFTRANLVSDLDTELLRVRLGGPGGGLGSLIGGPGGPRFALVLIRTDGTTDALPTGPEETPDPLPDVTGIGPDGARTAQGRIVDLPAVSGSSGYRARLVADSQDNVLVIGASLRQVDGPIGDLISNLAIIGALVLAAIVGVAAVLLRRGLRPLERIAETADAIAEGDLTQRTELAHDASEVGRLGTAFDAMVDRIQASFADQQAALDAKARSEDRLRRFVADASHELRTPLTALRGYADLYRAGGLSDDAAMEQAMRRIGTESMRMGALVEDLLLLARLDQGRPIRHDRVDLSALATDAVADAQAIEPERPVAADLRPGLFVTGDEDRLRQVVGNLFTNVRVHTGPSTPIEVRLGSEDGLAVLEVVDHGPGISPEHAERVFDRFYRADPGRSRDRGGSGLGLSIAASVVEAHGGSVEHRPTPGGGATFQVRLPIVAPA
jgi:two-component system OmpR family sensor kinase